MFTANGVVKPIKGKSKCDMLVEQVISLIVQKIYKSGDRLPTESEFAEQ